MGKTNDKIGKETIMKKITFIIIIILFLSYPCIAQSLITSWCGKKVEVELDIGSAKKSVRGTLLEADEWGIIVDSPDGKTYIPIESISNIVLK
jgi:hypothetical protein